MLSDKNFQRPASNVDATNMNQKIVVQKYGGAAIASPAHFAQVADIILSRKNEKKKIVVVVSAMGNTTDELIALAKKVNPSPPQRELDMLITAGERISIALLAMALNAKGCEAVSFTGSQSGIITTADHSNAKIIDVQPYRLLPPLKDEKIVIVAGFQGVSLHKEITSLGRGGSDTTAVALGAALEAESVEFFKDVEGVFDCDPKHHSNASIIPQMEYSQARILIESGAKVLSARSVRLAEKNALPLKVFSFHSNKTSMFPGTLISSPGQKRPPAPIFEEIA